MRLTKVMCVLVVIGSAGIIGPSVRAVEGADSCAVTTIQIFSRTGTERPVSTATDGYFYVQPDVNNIICHSGLYFGVVRREFDPRIIVPGANRVMVRVFGPYPPPRLTLSGLINRRGIKMHIERPPVPGTTLNTLYDSPWFPLDPTKKGSLTAKLGLASTTYHTVT